ncbi:DUF6234 family protein [Streptomyces mutabilis]|uniref:DUF6234 family protein n=1 Tax=Streptomyces mutabilis TaxID=67332 RepID=UPI0035EB3278
MVASMNLPAAPPAFDATTGPGPRRRADRGADIGAGCGLVLLELITLVVIFGLWFLSGFNLDPAKSVTTDPLWNYLAAAGGVGLLAVAAARDSGMGRSHRHGCLPSRHGRLDLHRCLRWR